MNVLSASLYYNLFCNSLANIYGLYLYLFYIYLLVFNLLLEGGCTHWECTRAASFTLLVFLNKYVVCFILVLFYSWVYFIRPFTFYYSFLFMIIWILWRYYHVFVFIPYSMTYLTGLCQYLKFLLTIFHSFKKSLIQEILKIL